MAEGIPYWDDDPEAWDLLMLGTNTLPGVWDIEDGNVKRVLDIKKAPGRDGAVIKDMGYENGALTLVGQLLGAEQWEQMQRISTTLRLTQKGKERSAVPISHPKALYLGITQVYVTEIQVPRLDNGVMTATIRVLEHIEKPKTANKTSPKVNDSDTEFQKNKFNAVTAGQQLNADEERARQQELQRAAREQQKKGRWPEFTAKTPSYAP